jgi:hypothetical protein
VRESVDVSARHDPSVHAVLDQLRASAGVGRHDRFAGGQRLDQRNREALPGRGQRNDVRRGEQVR